MKKKALTVILPLCVAMAMAACGGNADTAEVNETTVIEESMEADAQAEAEAPTMDEEAEVVEAEVTVDEEPEEVEEGYNPATQYEGKPYMVSKNVLDNDKSEEYGIYSESCFDLDQYLNEDGQLSDLDDFDKWNEYTGRWAYPEITQCDMFNGIYLDYKSDRFERFYFNDKKGNETSLSFDSGIGGYNALLSLAKDTQELDNPVYPKCMFTANTTDGTTNVLIYSRKLTYDDNDASNGWIEYHFNVGNFGVTVKCAETQEYEDPIEMTEEEIQEIIDNIRLTNGLER